MTFSTTFLITLLMIAFAFAGVGIKILLKKNGKFSGTCASQSSFLNKEGGILLIGVNDKGLINGIETELNRLWKTLDKLQQHFKNIRRDRIGINFDIYI